MSAGNASENSQLQVAIDRVEARSSWLQESTQRVVEFSERIQAAAARMPSFDRFVMDDRLATYLQHLGGRQFQLEEGMKRHREAHLLVSAVLPARGWYLSGKEPCTLSVSLANSVRTENWAQVDREVLQHLPEFKIDALKERLAQLGTPGFCVNRLCLFLSHHQGGRYEEATYIGVPLIDEIALNLYNGKAFTTKRGNKKRGDKSRPELSIKTAGGPELENYCDAFVQAFGSLQEDPDHSRLADEDYWNRHAIVHGMMRRAMGMKDSAKCLMAISFLFFARKDNDGRVAV